MVEATQEFFSRLENQAGIEQLFEYIPNIVFWAKDKNFAFVMGNQSLVEKCNCANFSEILGKTDFDFFPEELVHKWREDDKQVLQSGKKLSNRIELVPNEDGTVDWYSTNKIPLFSKQGGIMGVAGITKKLFKADLSLHPHKEMVEVIDYIAKNYHRKIKLRELAKISKFSVSQFGRKFKQIFRMTPEKFINSVKIKSACKALITSRESVKRIAYQTGFCNQSYFSKRFHAQMGMSPKSYRNKYYKGD